MLRQAAHLNQRRIVEVLEDALGKRHVPQIEIVVVEMKMNAAQRPRQLQGQRGLAGARAAGDPDHYRRKRQPRLRIPSPSFIGTPVSLTYLFPCPAFKWPWRFSAPAATAVPPAALHLPPRLRDLLMAQRCRAQSRRQVCHAGNPSTSMPMCRATIVSGTVDMPTSVAPSVRKARISAGVSKLGPGVARYTPSSSANPSSLRCFLRQRAQRHAVSLRHIEEAQSRARHHSRSALVRPVQADSNPSG